MDEFLPADNVVVTLSLTSQTESLVNAEAIAAMRPDAVLINVGRGPAVHKLRLQPLLNVLKG